MPQLIGRVGSTGNSTGPHLHLGPDDDEQDDSYGQGCDDEPADPDGGDE